MLEQVPIPNSSGLATPTLLPSGERTEFAVCIGTFDNAGIPISINKNLSDLASVAFQVISLQMLVACSLELGHMRTGYVHHTDGSVLRIERNNKGFVCYLESGRP